MTFASVCFVSFTLIQVDSIFCGNNPDFLKSKLKGCDVTVATFQSLGI